MLSLLWLVPALPLAGFILLAASRGRWSANAVALVGVGSLAAAASLALLIGLDFIREPPQSRVYTQTLWTWMSIGGFRPTIGLHLDPLSLVMMLVVTFVGFLIHLYSMEFMRGEEGYNRYFAYMNLFVAAMLVLVLADNLLFLYLGWEGVGVCSYLLIGFWYRDAANGDAARKAFVVTRVGDTALAIGLLLLFATLGTLDIQTLLARAEREWAAGSVLAIAAAALLLGGAVGKSAQLPLQTWLPDAMAGPTPVSALIHAATMVTAGVYLIARMHGLFTLAPPVQLAVAVIGAGTLLLAGMSALVQTDIKRVLAWSTISQIGYMFLALGVGAWSAAIFHFMTHAFFKALLFLAAGSVILALHHEHDIFRMGGLRRRLPLAFWTFVIGAASLAGLPWLTAGFYSKDLILWHAWASPAGGPWLWFAGWLGALLTALYIFRLLFIAFFGQPRTAVTYRPGTAMQIPLLVLAVLALVAGFVELPPALGNLRLLSGFLEPVLPSPSEAAGVGPATELVFQLLAAAASLGGLYLAWLVFLRDPDRSVRIARAFPNLRRFWREGWGFDGLYGRLFVQPFRRAAEINRDDVVDTVYTGIAALNRAAHGLLARTQSGNLRWYAAGITAGAALFLALVILPWS